MRKKALGIFARGEEQFDLFRVERADLFFEQEMKSHAHAGERRFQFVAHGRDEVCFHLVEQTEPSYILKHNGGAKNIARVIAHSNDARQNESFFVVDAQAKRLGQIRRQKSPPPFKTRSASARIGLGR